MRRLDANRQFFLDIGSGLFRTATQCDELLDDRLGASVVLSYRRIQSVDAGHPEVVGHRGEVFDS